MGRIVYLNGGYLPVEEAKISVMDRGFLLSDGVYEVIPVYGGKPFRGVEHLNRLQRSLDAIRLDYRIDPNEWLGIVDNLVKRNHCGETDCSIYLQVTRGVYEQRSHTFPEVDVLNPTCFAQCTPIPLLSSEVLERGMSAITRDNMRWSQCYIKSISLLPNVMLSQEAKELGATEAILVEDSRVVEGASSNIFVVKEGVLITPRLSEKILAGITREFILELARKHNIPYREANLTVDELRDADEIWVTSSTRMIYPIVKLDDRPVGDGKVGPVWHRMIGLYKENR